MNFVQTALTATAFVVAAGATSAATIDFETDGTGNIANGFQSDDSGIATFSDTSGSDLTLNNFGSQGDGNSLGVFGDDNSQLQIDFSQSITGFSIDFGNDDSGFLGGTSVFATIIGFLGGGLINQTTIATNNDDIMNQTGTLAGEFDQVFFYYSDAAGNAINLIEVVDNIKFDVAAIPLPAGGFLLLGGLGALGALRRRKKAA